MKKITKTSKAILFALLAMIICVAMALTACNGNNTPPNNGDDDDTTATVITKYDATFDASIVMGPMGEQSFASVFSDAYVTKNNNQYSLTVIFTAGELNVGGIKGTIFIDDNPTTEETVNGIKDGTIGFYKADGTLVTEGVKVTYSSGENYALNSAQQNVYYVQSVELPVDALRATYDLTLYINSNMMGKQFIKDVHDAKITLDLESGEVVNTITGLGVDTRGTVEPKPVEPVSEKYTKYEAQLDAVISMGQNVNFTENLFDGVYVIKKDSKYELTLIFKSGAVNMPFGNTMDGFLTNSECPGYRGGEPFMPVWGYYNGETLVTEGISLTYSSGDDYATVSAGNYYYVKSMTFAVDTLEDEYVLSLCVMAGNETSTSGQQFPYTSNSGTVCNATLTIDLTEAERVSSIDNLLGVDNLDEVPTQSAYTKYDANLSCYVTAMGGVEFGEGLLSGVYVEKDAGQYFMTLVFAKSQVTIMTITCDTFIDTAPANAGTSKGVTDGTIGFYDKNGTLVTEGVEVGYSSGSDCTTGSSGNVYYVKSVTMPVDELRSEYKLTLYVNSSVMGMQFCEANDNATGTTYSATLTLDLESGTAVENIDDLIGVPVRGEVPDPEYQVSIVSLETSAPLPAVKEAFNTAFGESVMLIVAKDGSMKLRIENKHMVINLFGNNFDANVAWVQGANVISTKTEVYSNINGDLTATPTQEEITVPDVFEISYPTDCNGVLTLTIGVDFMAKMNNQEIEEYSTNVTLTIDVSSLEL